MKDRLFILTNDPVPYGTANANYIRNFAKAVANEGWNVIIIGMKSDDSQPDFYRVFDNDENIQFWNFNDTKLGGKNYLRSYFFYEKKYRSAMKQFDINERDYIFVYSTELDTAKAAIKTKKVPSKHKTYSEVEWFQHYQYKHRRLNPLYILWKFGFQYRSRKFEKAIPISRNIEKYCISHNCKTLVVPALVDTNAEYPTNEHNRDSLVHFVYPGSASDKDSFPCMIQALAELTREEKKKVRFHLTGSMSREQLLQIGCDTNQVDSLGSVLIFHGWMDYNELINLYQKSDYLLLARESNSVTISNFPSKVPEMMCYGIIPVCSKVGDYTDLYLRDGFDSIQFYEDDVTECTAAIRRAINVKESHQSDQMKKNARNTAVTCFDCRVWGRKITEFLKAN